MNLNKGSKEYIVWMESLVSQVSWGPPGRNEWKMKTNTSWNSGLGRGGLGWLFVTHLDLQFSLVSSVCHASGQFGH